MLRQTKIVATLGPASSNPKTLRAMMIAGVNVVSSQLFSCRCLSNSI